MATTTDGSYASGAAIHLTEAYGVRGAFNDNGSPSGRPACSAATCLYVTTALLPIICADNVIVLTPDSTCKPNFSVSQFASDDSLDSCQELDVLGGNGVVPPRPEFHRSGGFRCERSEIGRHLFVQGPQLLHAQRRRSVQLLISPAFGRSDLSSTPRRKIVGDFVTQSLSDLLRT